MIFRWSRVWDPVHATTGPQRKDMMTDFERGVVPPGRYAQGRRSPIVWVFLCAGCAGFAPQTDADYSGALSGACAGCGGRTRELHRFRAWVESAAGCMCSGEHPRAVGDVRVPAAGGSSVGD